MLDHPNVEHGQQEVGKTFYCDRDHGCSTEAGKMKNSAPFFSRLLVVLSLFVIIVFFVVLSKDLRIDKSSTTSFPMTETNNQRGESQAWSNISSVSKGEEKPEMSYAARRTTSQNLTPDDAFFQAVTSWTQTNGLWADFSQLLFPKLQFPIGTSVSGGPILTANNLWLTYVFTYHWSWDTTNSIYRGNFSSCDRPAPPAPGSSSVRCVVSHVMWKKDVWGKSCEYRMMQ